MAMAIPLRDPDSHIPAHGHGTTGISKAGPMISLGLNRIPYHKSRTLDSGHSDPMRLTRVLRTSLPEILP